MGTLKLQGIVKRYGKTEILHGIDLEINDGEFVIFVGPSGCGKSTLLRVIAGLEQADEGEVFIDGVPSNNIRAAERGLAMVFQSYALYPHMSVHENLAFGLQNSKLPNDEVKTRVDDVAAMLQIDALLQRKPRELSGGQRQRVAIGRAIVRRPGIFLLDEPLSNLDAALRVVMRAELASLQKRLATTMIYVTHDQVEAMTLANRIVVLRGGIVEQVGSPLELYNRPDNLFVAGFIGSPKINIMRGNFVGKNTVRVGCADIEVPCEGVEGEIALGVRPHNFEHVKSGGICLQADIVEQLGAETVVYATDSGGEKITVVLPGQETIKRGDSFNVAVKPSYLHLFDKDGKFFYHGDYRD